MDLHHIKSPADIKDLSFDELDALCGQLRAALINRLSHTGGHIGPNLGMIEAIVALHYVFDSPNDKIVFDVSHQSYVHKMLTGRINAYLDPALYKSVSGFTSPSESEHDFFCVGHTSTAASLASGLAKARDMRQEHYNVISVIGDGSLSGGEAFEGLDFGATLDTNFIVVVNDNDMSIAPNKGGIYDNLRQLRESDGQAECNLFKAMGYEYRYVAYGNDVRSLVEAFQAVRNSPHPIVVHINTQKGKGFAPAEAHKERFHYGAPFDKNNGEPLHISTEPSYTSIFAEHMIGKMNDTPDLAIITAGTPGAIGFGPDERRRAGSRFIDVGIAEQDAVAMASGMAKGGVRPVFAVVSSFLQRAYDQLAQDVAINGNAAVLSIFHTGVHAMSDITHLGWFDIALVANIPGWVYLAPTCKEEYLAMLDWAVAQTTHPVAIRVPGGKVVESGRSFATDYDDLNRFEKTVEGSKVAIIAAGSFYQLGENTLELLAKHDINATLINPRFLSGLDTEMLDNLKTCHSLVVTLEDGVTDGGFGQKIAAYYGKDHMRVACYGLPNEFHDRYIAAELLTSCHLTPELLVSDIINLL